MVARQVTVYEDDFDGAEGAVPIVFSVNGRFFEVHLTDEREAQFFELLRPYMTRGRVVQNPLTIPFVEADLARIDLKVVRTWARAQGLDLVSDSGRLAHEVTQAYREWMTSPRFSPTLEQLKLNSRFKEQPGYEAPENDEVVATDEASVNPAATQKSGRRGGRKTDRAAHG